MKKSPKHAKYLQSCGTILQTSYGPSESFFKVKSLLKEIALEKPEYNVQATLKTDFSPYKSNVFKKHMSSEGKVNEPKSDSTRGSEPFTPKSPNAYLSHKEPVEKKFLIRPFGVKKSQSELIFLPIRPQQKCTLEYVLEGAKNSVNSMVALNGKLYSGDSDCIVRYWPLPITSSGVYTAKSYRKGSIFANTFKLGLHHKPIRALSMYSSKIISASSDGVIKTWITENSLHINKVCPGTRCLKVLANGELITAGTMLNFTDLSVNKPLRDPVCISLAHSLTAHGTFTFLIGSENCSVELWDLRAARGITKYIAHKEAVTGLAMSSGYSVLTCSEDKTLKEWDLRTNKLVSLRKSREKLRDILVVRDFVVTGGEKLTIWDREEDVVAWDGAIKNLHFSSEKKIVFAGGLDGKIIAWDFN